MRRTSMLLGIWLVIAGLAQAADDYERIIAKPGPLCDAMARYKLGWIHINNMRRPEAKAQFERIQMSKLRAVRIYEKLATRLFIIQQFPAAWMVYRHLLTLSDDPKIIAEWKQRLDDIDHLSPVE